MSDVLVDHIRAVLFDVDGTLYRQGPVRRAMLSQLAGAYWRRPREGARVARALAAYRRAQEELRTTGFVGDVTREQLDHAARRTGFDVDVIAASVERWMETTPLGAVAASGRHGLVDALDALSARGLMLGAVSDYPAERKLEALGIRDRFAVVISAQDSRVNAFKPNPTGLLVAAETLGVPPAEVLYVGDRSEVDAAAAAVARMSCLLVGGSKRRSGPHDRIRRIDRLDAIRELLGARMTTTTTPTHRVPLMSLSGRPTPGGHLAIMRVDHWFKQVFVLPGIAIALSDTTVDIPGGLVGRLVVGFLSVCLVSSSNYVINEMLDAPYDLFHPTKRDRPVPSGLVNIPLAYVQWIALAVVGVGLGFLVNVPLGYTMLALWVMGCIYNIPPIRSKDQPYLDVLSESINNPLRMLAGWYMTGTTEFAPTSLLVSYWMVGCYFMALKRYAEYNEIGDPVRAATYRHSFAYYTVERLLVSIMFYASTAMLFLGAFVMRYRLELILAFPLIAIVMALYLSLAFKPHSAVINPEKLYREPKLMLAVVSCAIVMLVFLFVDVPALDTIFQPTGLRVRT